MVSVRKELNQTWLSASQTRPVSSVSSAVTVTVQVATAWGLSTEAAAMVQVPVPVAVITPS